MGEQNVGDLQEIRSNVESWLQDKLPDHADLQVGELNFPASSGESSVTLILDATTPDGAGEKYVLRMVPPTSEVFESHDLQMQFEMMQVMHAEGIPVPPLVAYEPDPSILGSDFYVMNFVDGQIPPDNPPMVFGSWVMDLGSDQRRTMWRNGVETLAAIHGIKVNAHDFSRLPRADPGAPMVGAEIRKFDSMFRPSLREKADPRILQAWEYVTSNPPPAPELGLCWGDSRVGNVIWRDLAPVAVIDWEMANLGDPLSDLAWFVWIDRCNSIGLGTEAIGGVPEPGEIYEQWHQHTRRSIEHIPYFELFTVVRYAIILELKFLAMKAANPDGEEIPNFTVPFLPVLLEAARQS